MLTFSEEIKRTSHTKTTGHGEREDGEGNEWTDAGKGGRWPCTFFLDEGRKTAGDLAFRTGARAQVCDMFAGIEGVAIRRSFQILADYAEWCTRVFAKKSGLVWTQSLTKDRNHTEIISETSVRRPFRRLLGTLIHKSPGYHDLQHHGAPIIFSPDHDPPSKHTTSYLSTLHSRRSSTLSKYQRAWRDEELVVVGLCCQG